jgi:hypothetical protein
MGLPCRRSRATGTGSSGWRVPGSNCLSVTGGGWLARCSIRWNCWHYSQRRWAPVKGIRAGKCLPNQAGTHDLTALVGQQATIGLEGEQSLPQDIHRQGNSTPQMMSWISKSLLAFQHLPGPFHAILGAARSAGRGIGPLVVTYVSLLAKVCSFRKTHFVWKTDNNLLIHCHLPTEWMGRALCSARHGTESAQRKEKRLDRTLRRG